MQFILSFIYKLYDKQINSEDLSYVFDKLIKEFNVSLIEDPFQENDINSFVSLKRKCDNYADIIGDDLICTNYDLLNDAINKKAIDGIIIKINQCGTISETLRTIKLAKTNNIKTILSASTMSLMLWVTTRLVLFLDNKFKDFFCRI